MEHIAFVKARTFSKHFKQEARSVPEPWWEEAKKKKTSLLTTAHQSREGECSQGGALLPAFLPALVNIESLTARPPEVQEVVEGAWEHFFFSTLTSTSDTVVSRLSALSKLTGGGYIQFSKPNPGTGKILFCCSCIWLPSAVLVHALAHEVTFVVSRDQPASDNIGTSNNHCSNTSCETNGTVL